MADYWRPVIWKNILFRQFLPSLAGLYPASAKSGSINKISRFIFSPPFHLMDEIWILTGRAVDNGCAGRQALGGSWWELKMDRSDGRRIYWAYGIALREWCAAEKRKAQWPHYPPRKQGPRNCQSILRALNGSHWVIVGVSHSQRYAFKEWPNKFSLK